MGCNISTQNSKNGVLPQKNRVLPRTAIPGRFRNISHHKRSRGKILRGDTEFEGFDWSKILLGESLTTKAQSSRAVSDIVTINMGPMAGWFCKLISNNFVLQKSGKLMYQVDKPIHPRTPYTRINQFRRCNDKYNGHGCFYNGQNRHHKICTRGYR